MKWIVAASLIGMFLGASGVSVWPPRAQETEAEAEDEEPQVKEAEVQLYIDVYTEMQKDHGLVLAKALESRGLSVEQFRNIEQKVQRQPRLVDRVRKSLAEAVMARSGNAPKPDSVAKQ